MWTTDFTTAWTSFLWTDSPLRITKTNSTLLNTISLPKIPLISFLVKEVSLDRLATDTMSLLTKWESPKWKSEIGSLWEEWDPTQLDLKANSTEWLFRKRSSNGLLPMRILTRTKIKTLISKKAKGKLMIPSLKAFERGTNSYFWFIFY